MHRVPLFMLVGLMLISCAGLPVQTGTNDSKSLATGSAAGAHSQGANTALER